MKFYHLSKQRVRRVLNFPQRVEKGVAPKTIAMMQPAGSKKNPYEIWVMVQKISQGRKMKGQKLKIISTWKYPGRTKPRTEVTFELLKNEYQEFISKI